MPISTAWPRGRVERNAARIASGRPVASKAWSTPPPVAARTRSAVVSASVSQTTAAVAPNSAAACARSRLTSTATTGWAPAAAAPISADRPTPPQPNTATRSPGATRAVRHAAHTPVVTAQPTSAATANGTSAAMGMQERSGTTVCSANEEMSE